MMGMRRTALVGLLVLLVAVAATLSPALTQPAEADLPSDVAADFNHDSFADLGVGAPWEDVGSAGQAGAVSVLPGSAGGLTATGGRLFTQVGGTIEADDQFGAQLAAGDFNDNGFADLAAAAP